MTTTKRLAAGAAAPTPADGSRRRCIRAVPVLAGLLLAGAFLPASAQQSASFRLEEHVFNQGGRPDDGATASSASYRISLDSLGEAAVRRGLSSASFRMDASFVGAHPPPGEVRGVLFTDRTTLTWDPEPSVGVYDVYRDGLSALAGGGYGICWQEDLVGESAADPDAPAAGTGWFYLVTAENRLGEAGTKGRASDGAERLGDACP